MIIRVAWGAVLVALTLTLAMLSGVAFAEQQPSRGVVVVLDTSGSMAPDRIVLARKAITDYVGMLPPDVRVGFVAFSETPRLLVAPTTDRAQVTSAVNAVQTKGDTALYDALPVAVAALDGITERRVVVVSDGEDTASKSSLDSAIGALVTSGITADVIGFQYVDSALRRIADTTGGRLLTADDAPQLAAAFATLVVPTTAPAVSASTTAEAPAAAMDVRPTSAWRSTALVVGGTFVVLLLIGLLLIHGSGRRGPGQRLERQIGRYGPARRVVEPADEEGSVARTALNLTERVLGERRTQAIATRLDLAGMRITPAEWTLLRLCLSIGLAAAFSVVLVVVWLAVPLGVLLGWAGSAACVSVRTSRRRAAFGEQLPDVLQLIAGSLRSGFSLAQSIDAVVRDITQPAAGEFSRALAATRIGAELEDALDQVAHRMRSQDLRWVVMAIRIQRQVGGNLAEVLLNTVGTMRERAQTRRRVRALSAEGRLSAYILIALPILLAGWLFYSRAEYMRPLYTTAIGIVMLAGGSLLVVLGAFWMRVLVKVEV